MRLIDADAFDKMLVDAQAECKSNGGNFRFGVLSNVRENLRMMPTIEQLQPRKGKWLEYAGDQKCSVCGSSYSDLFPEYDRTPFCPHCGAKMEEGDGDG